MGQSLTESQDDEVVLGLAALAEFVARNCLELATKQLEEQEDEDEVGWLAIFWFRRIATPHTFSNRTLRTDRRHPCLLQNQV